MANKTPANVPQAVLSKKKQDGRHTSGVAQATPPASQLPIGVLPGMGLPKQAILKPRSREPSKIGSVSRGRSVEKGEGSQRTRSRGEERAELVGLVLESRLWALIGGEIHSLPILPTRFQGDSLN